MLTKGFTYPVLWPVTYHGRDHKKYASAIDKVHFDDSEPYYTIQVLEGPYNGERQTVAERLSSWIDKRPLVEIKEHFDKYVRDIATGASSRNK